MRSHLLCNKMNIKCKLGSMGEPHLSLIINLASWWFLTWLYYDILFILHTLNSDTSYLDICVFYILSLLFNCNWNYSPSSIHHVYVGYPTWTMGTCQGWGLKENCSIILWRDMASPSDVFCNKSKTSLITWFKTVGRLLNVFGKN